VQVLRAKFMSLCKKTVVSAKFLRIHSHGCGGIHRNNVILQMGVKLDVFLRVLCTALNFSGSVLSVVKFYHGGHRDFTECTETNFYPFTVLA
jgi:NAD/NADP transhydrogenase beta subunit